MAFQLSGNYRTDKLSSSLIPVKSILTGNIHNMAWFVHGPVRKDTTVVCLHIAQRIVKGNIHSTHSLFTLKYVLVYHQTHQALRLLNSSSVPHYIKWFMFCLLFNSTAQEQQLDW